MKHRQSDPLPVAAAKAGISRATAYWLLKDEKLPSQKAGPPGRGRPDPLAEIFNAEIVPLLQAVSGLRAVAIFEEILRRHPDLSPDIRRTMERRIRTWRARHGEDQKVICRQTHESGRMGLSDFTDSPGAKARNETLCAIKRLGRAIWKKRSGYHRRSLVETKMHCFKLLGPRVASPTLDRQTTELKVRAKVLNRFSQIGSPTTIRVA